MEVKIKHLVIAPVLALFLFIALTYLSPWQHNVIITASLTFFIAYLWVTEALPIPVTSLIPFFAFPIAGVINHKEAASALGSHVILLLMGAFMLAKAIEKSKVHERIALGMVSFIGSSSAFKLIFAFMASAAVLSMWISNTATVLALLPVAIAVTQASADKKFKIALLLGLAYSASLGGVGTLIGTPPNVIFASVYEEFAHQEFNFLQWMKTGIPIILLAIPLMAWWLSRGVTLNEKIHLPKVGVWRTEEVRALLVFGFIAMLWVFRKAPFGGWSGLFDLKMVGDSSIALFGVVLMFLVNNGKQRVIDSNPSKTVNDKLLDWKTASDIPWGMLLLFAGGICIAKAFVASGLSEIIGQQLSSFTQLPTLLLLFALCISVSFLTEITSNTATATLLMPILASAAIGANLPIELLMIPAVISCSCAFCLPVATAPNSIVFASGEVTIADMARQGIALNVIVAVVTTTVCYFTLL
ncbi:SLC13 family permease [Flocculibacter collagenilyticus]|uniref:SLC13 family permease n=1 Tax=Flocculibacter collagenilyticus TaxID=2744479 RepID=UPI0018F73B1E|nr:SLC13 family permease [Flocculibacter collagenilyticus]